MASTDKTIPCPVIGMQGWTFDTRNKLDTLMSDFLLTDYNQSYLFSGGISSLQRILQKNGWLTHGCEVELKGTLTTYLGRHFDNVSVEVTTIDDDTNLSTSFTMRIDVEVVEKGYSRTDSWAVDSRSGKTSKVADLLNG